MPLLVPDWNQPRPTIKEVLEVCRNIRLTPLGVPTQPFETFLTEIRSERRNGGAYLNVFDVGPSPVFDWFASRSRLWDDRLLDWLALHPTIAQSFTELRIPDSPREDSLNTGFACSTRFYSTAPSLVCSITAVHTPKQAAMGTPKRNLRWTYAMQCLVFDTER